MEGIAVSVRAYTLSAIAVTASAVAGLWFGVVVAHGQPGTSGAVLGSNPEAAVISVTPAPGVLTAPSIG